VDWHGPRRALPERSTEQAKGRIKHNVGPIDSNDDKMVKSLADNAFEAEAFRWNTI
jgi:hypothetical protein